MDFDNIDLDEVEEFDLDTTDLSGFGEVEEEINVPHVKVSTKAFKNVLKTARSISCTGRDILTKSICFKVKGEKLYCYMTDFEIYVEESIPILNNNDVLTEFFIVPSEILDKLIKAVPSNVVIYKDLNEKYYIKLYGGDIPLDTYQFDFEKFIYSEEVEEKSTIDSKDLLDVIQKFNNLINNAVSYEKRIYSESDNAYASYMWSMIRANKFLFPMDLKIKDCKVLKTILNESDEEITVYQTPEDAKTQRCILQGDNFKYVFLLSTEKFPSSKKDIFDEAITETGVVVDMLKLYRVVEVASELPYSLGKISIGYDPNGISLVIKTKKGIDSKFVIDGYYEGEKTDIEAKEVQAKLLKILLRSYTTPTVKIMVSKKGIAIDSGDYQSVILSENM